MIALPMLMVLVMCWGSVLALHAKWVDWSSTTYMHGYLILAISVWLLWRDRAIRRSYDITSHGYFHVCFATAATAWLFSALSGFIVVDFAMVPLLLWLAVLASHGLPPARRCGFPIAYLYFAIPVWGSVNPIFQWSTVYAVRVLLRIADVPAYFDGNQVQIPEGVFEIADGCSGLHFVIVALAIAALLGELRGDDWRGRVKLIVLAGALAVLTNWVRVFTLVLVGHATNMQHYLVAQSHYFFGWLLFAVAMTIFFLVERRLPLVPGSAAFVPSISSSLARKNRNSTPRWSAGLTFALCALVAVWHVLALRPTMETLSAVVAPPGWEVQAMTGDEWRPEFAGVDLERWFAFRRGDGSRVLAYEGSYNRQYQGKEFSGYLNDVRGNAPPEAPIWVGFDVDGRRFHRPAIAQMWYALKSMAALRAPPSQVLALQAVCQNDCTTSTKWLDDFHD